MIFFKYLIIFHFQADKAIHCEESPVIKHYSSNHSSNRTCNAEYSKSSVRILSAFMVSIFESKICSEFSQALLKDF